MTKPYKCRVEYLESTGTQYIDTGYKPNNNTEYEVSGYMNPSGVFGVARWSGEPTYDTFGAHSITANPLDYYGRYSSNKYLNLPSSVFSKQIIWKHTSTNISIKNAIDGTSYVNQNIVTDVFQSTYNMWIFGFNNMGTILSRSVGCKINTFKIWDNGVLIRNFIPVLDNSGRPAMYDQVSGQMFYNQGTGEFTYGRQIIPVEYLESSDTQYIDTGVVARSNITVSCDWMFLNYTSSERSCAIAAAIGSGNTRIVAAYAYNGQFRFAYGTNTHVGTCEANTRYKTVAVLNQGEQSFSVNGTTLYTGTSSASISANRNLTLFEYAGTSSYVGSFARIYSCSIIQDGVLVRDFIPCIDENLVPFMFDKVHNMVYLNAGTGQFKVGPNVERVWRGKKLRRKLALALANLKKQRKYYCEVEYLKSSGSTTDYQWIDTGFKPTTNTKVRCILACTDMGTANNITFYGARTGAEANTNFGLLNYKGNSKLRFDRGNYNNSGSYGPLSANTFYEIVQDKNKNYVDGISAPDSTGTFANVNYNIFVFGINDNGSYLKDQTPGAGVWKESQKSFKLFQIYDNGVLVRDFIPVLDWNMAPCMYDRVTEQLFYNQGTGSFTYGREIHYVDYLESTGTQYIDTGITLTNNHSVEVDYQLTSASQNRKGIFGGLIANGARFGALLSPSNNYLEFGYGSTNVFYQPGLPDTNRHVMKQEKNLLYFDGVLTYTFSTATFTQNFTAPLGNFTYTNYNPASAKYYSSKWWDNDTLVRDYIPAIDENGVGFMFDKVTHSCFLNVGTGAFKYPAKEISYLQSTGTQYIDTNYMPNQDTKIELIGKFNNTFPGCLWATRWSQSPNYDTYGAYAENNSAGMLYIYYGRYSSGSFTSVSNSTFPHRDGNFISFIQDKNKLDFTNLGTNANWTYTFSETTFQSTRNLTLFYFSSSSAFATKGGYIKSCKIWDNNVMVRDMVTCFKDGVMGMWDKANSVFYQNAGTGSFSVGKVVEPEYE